MFVNVAHVENIYIFWMSEEYDILVLVFYDVK